MLFPAMTRPCAQKERYKEGRKGVRKEGCKEGRVQGRNGARKEGCKEGRV
jgi:hypothetical protein